MTLVLHYAARSDRGLVRSNNQDSVYAGPRLLALADGMGGHAAGEVASKVVIAALAPLDDDEPGDDLLGHLRQAVLSGNGAISELVSHDPDLDGMGTTLTAVLFAGSKLGLVHIGDSRAYLVRDGELSQITHDDTFVQSLIDEGRITEEEAANHPQRSLLLKALTGHEVEPSLAVREARAGDRYLLCSDGLTSPVSEETMAEALRIADPQACADRMIELALRGGGPDNVTVIVADVVDVEFGEDAPIVGGAAGVGEEDPQPDSSAARASAATLPKQPQQRYDTSPPPDQRTHRRGRLRALLVTCGVLAVLVIAALVGRWWVLNQYYIGVNQADDVVIFQGLQGSALGVSLRWQVEDSCPQGSAADCKPIGINDLQEARRTDVRSGITDVNGLEAARESMRRLRMNSLLPQCEEPKPEPPQQPTPPPADNPAPGSTPPGAPATSTAPGQPPSPPSPPPSPTDTPLVSVQQTPGVTCRTVS
ncbi:MAG: serine/threonine-protein phosphatase [Saccharopolyspora sp.]|uniref:PP2C family protein-serine/threonine phosphatase n=1 Tax=Saccharopolyspora TaxID=1835 RepID=UPI00190C5423|nr:MULTISPECIES: PP2C family serine/threonine-protein phosphatase [unclassified Saccharopolyspora]MBK0865332.1 serine/threonine-protein phosphatase [Saccharopolyspora sp. HNM0986]MBQ6640933.1 serine/threonine-protein phosphatase [Saccharopolyspora sp.]